MYIPTHSEARVIQQTNVPRTETTTYQMGHARVAHGVSALNK